MLYPIGTHRQLQAIKEKIPALVLKQISDVIEGLDNLYGKERDFYDVGGYIIFAETREDIFQFQNEILDYTAHPCEWHYAIDDYISILFLLNNDFTVTLIAHKTITPKEILEDS
ncbi:MAG: hypothetical protein IJ489_06485 [Clostridia bacterium]|nr:hypothetical protein [Clostridia bacterium]